MKADLHMHSTASDGTLSPEALAGRAAQLEFDVIALSDHDSMEGVRAAQKEGARLGVRVMAAAELSCGAGREIHILGYGMDADNTALLDFFERKRIQRETRAEQMVMRLSELGKGVSFERVRELAQGAVGRPHIARALVEAGHVLSVSEAFDRFLASGKPAYVPKEEVKVAEAVRLINGAGGVAVLAHPMELKMGEMAIEALVHEWKGQGLAGLEVYHPSAANNHASFLLALARREGMLITGGSDYHGSASHRGDIGEGLERWRTMQEDVQRLDAAITAARGRMHGA